MAVTTYAAPAAAPQAPVETAGTMGGKVVSKGPDAFEFTLAGGPPGAKPLLFQRRK